MQERCQRKEQELLMSRQEKNTMLNKGRTDFGIQHQIKILFHKFAIMIGKDACKGICIRYNGIKKGSSSRFANSQRRSQVCDVFLKWENACGVHVAVLRNKVYREKLKSNNETF